MVCDSAIVMIAALLVLTEHVTKSRGILLKHIVFVAGEERKVMISFFLMFVHFKWVRFQIYTNIQKLKVSLVG